MNEESKAKLKARKAKCWATLIAGGRRKMKDVPEEIKMHVNEASGKRTAKKLKGSKTKK